MHPKNLSEWVELQAGAEIMDITYDAISRLIAEGYLTVRRIPTTRPKVLRSECEQLAARSVVEARHRPQAVA